MTRRAFRPSTSVPAVILFALILSGVGCGAGATGDSVTGHLVVTNGSVSLCGALSESSPPGCGDLRARVVGLDVDRRDALADQSAGSVAWSSDPVTLRGSLRDGVLRVR